jgi:hypothetical protein
VPRIASDKTIHPHERAAAALLRALPSLAIRNTQAFAARRASPLTLGFGPRKMDCHDRHSNVPFERSF